MTAEPDRLALGQTPHQTSMLVLFPMGATFSYYALPLSLQANVFVQFVPQLLAYAALGLWASGTSQVADQLGLKREKIWDGVRWGTITGLLLGSLNTVVILSVYPSLGYDITFLKQTPHGQLPFFVMVPWFTCVIALCVEINFRGFLLGRLAELEGHWTKKEADRRLAPLALLASAFTFAFDPFMVNTFQYLHWIALWDGLIWGIIWLRTRNLWTTIIAHAVEVMILYSTVKIAIG